jgi:hypothetical protein
MCAAGGKFLRIEGYEFGRIVIDGRGYEKDVVILTNGEIIKRKKKLSKGGVGHTPLSKREFKEYLRVDRPDVFVIGRGMHGAMSVKGGVMKIGEKHGIELICEDTAKAIESYLDLLSKGKKVAALFHLTC